MTEAQMQKQLAHVMGENAALWSRLAMGKQIKADAGVSAELIRVRADLDFLKTEVGLVVAMLRDAGLYEYSDPLRDALLRLDE